MHRATRGEELILLVPCKLIGDEVEGAGLLGISLGVVDVGDCGNEFGERGGSSSVTMREAGLLFFNFRSVHS